jgi:hypothetical protein
MTKELTANSPKLWQQALAATLERFPKAKHNAWETRSYAVNWYWDHGGRFVNLRPPAQLTNPETAPVIKNMLARNRIPITASLMARSLQHQWREYLGHSAVIIEPPEDASGQPATIKPGGFFGIKAVTNGYNLLLPTAQNTNFLIPYLTGYSLMTLSRELSLREMKYRD